MVVEENAFENGILTSGFIYRVVNNKVQNNILTELRGNKYLLAIDDEKQWLNLSPVKYSTLDMYFHEPVNIQFVYTNMFQKVLPIVKAGDQVYKLKLPDGSTNEFQYANGVCHKMIHRTTLYRTDIELKKIIR